MNPDLHVLNINYGLKLEDVLKTICDKADEYRTALGIGQIDGFLRQAIRNDIYDSIFLKTTEDNWSTIMMHDQERYAETHFLRTRLSEFMINDVATATGMSFPELLQLPTFLVEHILSTLRQTNAGGRVEAKRVEKELAKQHQDFQNIKQR